MRSAVLVLALVCVQAAQSSARGTAMNVLEQIQAHVKTQATNVVNKALDPVSTQQQNSKHEPMLLQESLCLISYQSPCVQALFDGSLLAVTQSEAAADTVAAVNEFCADCTSTVADLDAAILECEVTVTEDVAGIRRMAQIMDQSCEDPECSGNALWALFGIDERQDTYCEHQACSAELTELVLNTPDEDSEAEFDSTCATSFLEMMCLEDSNTGEFCLASMQNSGDAEDFSVASFCDGDCAADLTAAILDLEQNNCGNFDVVEDCENNYTPTLLDMCTVNAAGEFCMDLIESQEGPENCDSVFSPVPAPGMENNETPECSAECVTDLESYIGALGCCGTFSLDFTCADDTLRDAITDTCGVGLPASCARPAELAGDARTLSRNGIEFVATATLAIVAMY